MRSRITLSVICTLAVFLVACMSGKSGQVRVGTAALASVTPTPTAQKERANMSKSDSPNTINGQRKSERSPRLADTEWIMPWRRLVQASGSKRLEYMRLKPDEIEIRVWQVPGLFTRKTKCWIFSRKAGVWKGSAIIDREFSGRLDTASLDGPPLGSTKWEDYVNQNLTPQNISEAAKTIKYEGPEGEFFVVEVKFGKVYERQFMANDEFLEALFRTIKSEFFMNDNNKWSKF